MNIEHLISLEEIMEKLQQQGVDTIKKSSNYSREIVGSLYSLEGGVFKQHPLITKAVEDNLVVSQTGIDYILSLVENPELYQEEFANYMTAMVAVVEDYSRRKNPITISRNYFGTAFGSPTYDDHNMKRVNGLAFKGLSKLLKKNLLGALAELSQRKAYSIAFLASPAVLSYTSMDYASFKDKIHSGLRSLYDRHDWWSVSSIDVEAMNSVCGVTEGENMITAHFTKEDIISLYSAKLDPTQLRFNSKKCIVTNISEVARSEIEDAAKKIKTVSDVSELKVYKINKGIYFKNSQKVNDYWNWRRVPYAETKESVCDLAGNYIAIIHTADHVFQTVGSSLGRVISSSSKQLQNKVLDSLDLDSLI